VHTADIISRECEAASAQSESNHRKGGRGSAAGLRGGGAADPKKKALKNKGKNWSEAEIKDREESFLADSFLRYFSFQVAVFPCPPALKPTSIASAFSTAVSKFSKF